MLIKEFYAGREIFITGGTGFLGMACIEKLLRSCPNISKIYVMTRPKKGKNMFDRLDDLSKNVIFERLHKERPNIFKEKLFPISGDCCEIGLGIGKEDLEKLKNVSIIFHGAANVRFDNTLAGSTLMNVRGTWELVKIAETLKNLIAFVHISTAYINPNDVETRHEEKIFHIPCNWRTTIKLAENYNEEILDTLRLKYSSYFPNSYSFTKNLCEQVIEEYSERLPMVIFRPSIVVGSYKEPMPGWLSNFNGPMGMLTSMTIGIQRYSYARAEARLSFIPADIVTRLTIVAAYKRGLETMMSKSKNASLLSSNLDIINCCADTVWPLNIYQSALLQTKYHHVEPMQKTLWTSSVKCTSNLYWYMLWVFLFDIPLALIYDGLLKLSKRKPMTMNLLRRIVSTELYLFKFSSKTYKFKTDNMVNLDKIILPEDKDEFSLQHLLPIDFDYFFYYCNYGIKKYLMKEAVKSSSSTQFRYKTIIVLDNIFKLLLFTAFSYIIWMILC